MRTQAAPDCCLI